MYPYIFVFQNETSIELLLLFIMNEYNASLSAVKQTACTNILLILPFKEEFSCNATLSPNVTTYTEVLSNQLIYDETSRVMELYAALQAMIDFNRRSNAIVSIVGDYVNETCPNLRVPSITVSSSEKAFYNILGFGTKNNSIALLPDYDYSNCDPDEAMSIVGPMDSNVMDEVVKYSTSKNIFQMTPFSFFDENEIKDNASNNFARSTSDAKHLARSFVDYLRFLQRDYVAILYDIKCEFCKQTVSHIIEIEKELTIVGLLYDCKDSVYKYCEEIFMELKWMKFSTIIIVEGDKMYQDMDQIMDYSIKYGLVSKEHMWIVIPNELNDDYYIYRALKCFPRGSKEELFVRGLSIYEYRRNLRYNLNNFLVEGELDSNIVSLIESRTSMTFARVDFYEVLNKKTLSNAAYVYDTAISMLFSLCENGSTRKSNLLTLLRSSPKFTGASGFFSIDDDGTRADLDFFVSYIDDNVCTGGIGHLVTFNVNANGTWKSIAEGMYFDGTASPPDHVRIVNEDLNFLSPAEYWTTFGEVVLVVCACASLSFLVEKFKDKRRVQLGQPFYLHSLCFSCALFSLHIIPFGFDENNVPFDTEALDTLCVMVPILRSTGYLFILYSVFIKVR